MSILSSPFVGVPEPLPLKQFSTSDYLQMIEAGVLRSRDHVELIGGMIVNMSPQGTRHNHFLMNVTRLFAPLMERYVVAIQATVAVAEGSVFDPDLVLLQRRPSGYKERHPQATDVLLVVEASDSSLARDQKVKLPIYAAAGIQEYWIADLEQETIVVHREPKGEQYQFVESRTGDGIVSPLAAADFSFAVRQAFE